MDNKVHFNSASAAGVNIPRKQLDDIMQNFPPPSNRHAVPHAPMGYTTDKVHNLITNATVKWMTRDCCELHGLVALYGVFTRFNTAFRGFVQEVVNEFRATRSPVFHPNMTCVAVHVRRDDRALPGVDMMEWCGNHTIVDDKGRKTHTGNWTDGVRQLFDYLPLVTSQSTFCVDENVHNNKIII